MWTLVPGPPPACPAAAGPPSGRARRFGTDVAAAGGVAPALACGLDPANYPVVPGGVPQAWERARVYLGLYERYQQLYQTQVTELCLLLAASPVNDDKALLQDPSGGER